MRGARVGTQPQAGGTGIIPADAGSTLPERLSSLCFWDHPRGCGEHIVIGSRNRGDEGSSPRMRGARRLLGALEMISRIIPADAGSTP